MKQEGWVEGQPARKVRALKVSVSLRAQLLQQASVHSVINLSDWVYM